MQCLAKEQMLCICNLRRILTEGDRGILSDRYVAWADFFWRTRISELGASLLILVGTKPLKARPKGGLGRIEFLVGKLFLKRCQRHNLPVTEPLIL